LRVKVSIKTRPILVTLKRSLTDLPLVTLGLVVDADGFPKKSGFFDGNVSEPATIKDMLSSLSHPSISKRPLIVLDAGCATEENLKWLKAKGYGYIVCSRRKKSELPASLEMSCSRRITKDRFKGGS
jgi:transposase